MKALLPVLLLLCSLGSRVEAADVGQPVILVAAPEFVDRVYAGSVVLAVPIGEDRHIGFIVNRPTAMKLGQLFPEHGPSQKVLDPVFYGGPADPGMLFALVGTQKDPGGLSLQLGGDLFVIFDGETVDRIIEAESDHARFYAGLVAWQPGELRQEINRGLWTLAKPDASFVLRKSTQGLWEEMIMRARVSAGSV